jgi:hypothetical protein
MKRSLGAVLVLAALGPCCQIGPSGDLTADSPRQADVQAAIDRASDGDTVVIPAGDVTWTGGIRMPSDKTLRVEGKGIGRTVIRASGTTIFALGTRGHTIGNIESERGIIEVNDSQGFRIHHCRFSDPSEAYDVITGNMSTANFPNLPWGVIDNCEFFNGRIVALGGADMLSASNVQHRLWAVDAPLGDPHAIYVEDCTWDRNTHGPAVDGSYGGRFVFRHNSVRNSYIEAHSVQGNNRAIRTWEVYDNTLEGGSTYRWAPTLIRGGTGVVFNNVIKGYGIQAVVFNNVRDTESREVCGQCDGSSLWDTNSPGEGGWRCRDQIGSGKDAALWDGASPSQQSAEPAYVWDNVDGDGQSLGVYIHNPAPSGHIRPNRDYYLQAKPGYTPYTYPHPLRRD